VKLFCCKSAAIRRFNCSRIAFHPQRGVENSSGRSPGNAFTFRFNRQRSKSRGKLFFRLAQQDVAVDPVTPIIGFIPMQRPLRNHNLLGLPESSRYLPKIFSNESRVLVAMI
jgi:hypothetical protein